MTASAGRGVFQGISGCTGWKRVNTKEKGGAEVDIRKGYEQLKNQTTRGMEKAVAMKASDGGLAIAWYSRSCGPEYAEVAGLSRWPEHAVLSSPASASCDVSVRKVATGVMPVGLSEPYDCEDSEVFKLFGSPVSIKAMTGARFLYRCDFTFAWKPSTPTNRPPCGTTHTDNRDEADDTSVSARSSAT
jgi:hypothetical protein